MNSSDTKTTPMTSPSVRSRSSTTAPSRTRSGGAPSGAGSGRRRAASSSAASATTRLAAFTSRAISMPPKPASRPPTGGPAVMPA